ncbi:hypothetical protein CRG98_013009 [Punica granatum]|uniref:Uncharacterized protein n=1 Tax=Punica granatum TaxID=22663 RepID=A0A2I0KEB8_PUNGR|nr:hypothetical protein CRG98_013009 [Punica granatum]
MSKVARRTCGVGKLQEARARWLGELAVQESCKRHERGGSANLRCRKVSSHGLADPARLQKSKLARVCAPEFYLVRARMREAYATRLGSVHLPGDARRTRVRRSRHLLFTTRRSRAVKSPGSRGTGYTKMLRQ